MGVGGGGEAPALGPRPGGGAVGGVAGVEVGLAGAAGAVDEAAGAEAGGAWGGGGEKARKQICSCSCGGLVGEGRDGEQGEGVITRRCNCGGVTI